MRVLRHIRVIVRRLCKVPDKCAVLVKLAVLILHTNRADGVHAPVHKCGQERKRAPLVDAPLRAGSTVVVDVPARGGG